MDKDLIPVFVGYDPREAAAYHVFCQSVIEKSSRPVAFIPLHKQMLDGFDGQRNGTNAFIFSRYLVPMLCNYRGWAIFCDGDMVMDRDIADLWEYQNVFIDKALAVVQHEYSTKRPRKYIGSKLESDNVDYPRKNWSSVVLWNCAHFANRWLDRGTVAGADPAELHRFSWLNDTQIGSLPPSWNYLVGEDPPASASLYHYTTGVPGIKHYADDHASWHWHTALLTSLGCAGEDPVRMVTRAQERIGEL